MNHKFSKKYILTSLFLFGALIVVVRAVYIYPSGASKPVHADIPIDVIGTHSGTTTVGVSFPNFTAGTTTYPLLMGSAIDTAIFTLRATNASSTGGKVLMTILASNDVSCDTASTTYSAALNSNVAGDINWHDAANHINSADIGGLTLTTSGGGTTTLAWTPFVGQGTEITLTNLNETCLALQVNGTSTVLWSQMIGKGRLP